MNVIRCVLDNNYLYTESFDFLHDPVTYFHDCSWLYFVQVYDAQVKRIFLIRFSIASVQDTNQNSYWCNDTIIPAQAGIENVIEVKQ